jgi:hypothetical protein
VTGDTSNHVVRVITAIVDKALARCDREGIPWDVFYEAMQAEFAAAGGALIPELLERIFDRIKRGTTYGG